ncbi:hypothetical protein HDV01_004209 [Terramyces sp. JEL0728]|nr:hypothetical protein HDV01_004209 [Terramyces sp. JEL0728]
MDELKFRRLIDGTVIFKNTKPDALACLQTMSLILTNLRNYPDDPKFKSIKALGKVIKKILDCIGGEDLLIACGALKSVVEFQAVYTFRLAEESQLQIINEYIASVLELMNYQKSKDVRKEEEERKQKVLKEIEFDRLERKERQQVELERRVRLAETSESIGNAQ